MAGRYLPRRPRLESAERPDREGRVEAPRVEPRDGFRIRNGVRSTVGTVRSSLSKTWAGAAMIAAGSTARGIQGLAVRAGAQESLFEGVDRGLSQDL